MDLLATDIFYWAAYAFMGIGYLLAVIDAFGVAVTMGWWSLLPPLNLLFAYIYRCLDRKPFFFYAAGIVLWIITYLIDLVTPTANAAPWHGFELA